MTIEQKKSQVYEEINNPDVTVFNDHFKNYGLI